MSCNKDDANTPVLETENSTFISAVDFLVILKYQIQTLPFTIGKGIKVMF